MARPIASKYQRRTAALRALEPKLKAEARQLYEEGLKRATQEQLYDRTPLKVTGAMLRSVQATLIGDTIVVGYKADGEADHVPRRLNMKGRSKAGGHDLEMKPNTYLRNRVDPKVRRMYELAQKRINEGTG